MALPQQHSTSDHNPSVLLVDDDVGALSALADILSMEGYDVSTATNGREALDYLRHSPSPRLIILDLVMPVMDGWQFLNAKKNDPNFSRLPVVVVSALDSDVDARAVIRKPVDVEQLLTLVNMLVGDSRDATPV